VNTGYVASARTDTRPKPVGLQTLLGTSRARLLLALVVVYFVWGSTYLVMRFAMVGYPPLLMG